MAVPLLGCTWFEKPIDWTNSRPPATNEPAADNLPTHPTDESPAKLASATSLERPAIDIKVMFMLVQVPSRERAHTAPLWNYLNEGFLDAATQTRLANNGFRVGRGDLRDWPAVKANLDAIAGMIAKPQAAIALQPEWPFGLYLDSKEHDQTLFVFERDNVLSGDSWPKSRNVMRITSLVHPESAHKMRLMIVPEVRQRGNDWRFVRTEAGVQPQIQYSGRSFGAAGFLADLSPGEFLLIAPGNQSQMYGIIGGAFLTADINDESHDYMIFVRVDNNDDRSF